MTSDDLASAPALIARDLTSVAQHGGAALGASFRRLAACFSTPRGEVTMTGAVAPAAKTLDIGVARIEVGPVGAWRIEVTGLRGRPEPLERALLPG